MYLQQTANGYVDLATGEIFESIEVDTRQHSIVVDNTTVQYIVKQVFGSEMPDHSKLVFGNKIILDGVSTYSIVVQEYDNIYDLYIHAKNDREMHCRRGRLI